MPGKRAAEPTGLAAHVVDVLGDIECRRYFGGWSLAKGGVQFAMVMEDVLYFTVGDELRAALKREGAAPFSYAKGGTKIVVERLYTAPSACLDDPDALRHWANAAIAASRSGKGSGATAPRSRLRIPATRR